MKRRMRKGASSVGNVIRIVRSDFKRLFANAMSVIIVIGLVVMPSIFAWYNVIACWNVFDNTGNLTVAVANVDDGYESDLVPLRVNIGERVVSALRANDQIDWTFTTEEDAVDGARSGRYYAAVVIPAGFSKDMLTFYSEDVQHARIVYYANEKKSAIAPKITDHLCDECRERAELNPLRAFDCKNPHCHEIMQGAPLMRDCLCDDCREHYEQVKRYLDAAGIEYVEDPTLVRGLDYYTRTVFEVEAPGAGVGSIGGGGRYDGLVELEGGKPTPGVGFAVGFERIALALEAFGVELGGQEPSCVFIANAGADLRGEVFALSRELRGLGVRTECDYQGK